MHPFGPKSLLIYELCDDQLVIVIVKLEVGDLVHLCFETPLILNHRQLNDFNVVGIAIFFKESEMLFEGSLDVKVTKEDCCTGHSLFESIEHLQVALYDKRLRLILVHMLQETLSCFCETVLFFLFNEGKPEQLRLPSIANCKEHNEGPFEPVLVESLVDKDHISSLQIGLFHLL
jgi:hypothetical protein